MEIILCRHAEAEDGLSDMARRLTAKGEKHSSRRWPPCTTSARICAAARRAGRPGTFMASARRAASAGTKPWRFFMRAPGLDLLDNGLESFVTNNRLPAHGRES